PWTPGSTTVRGALDRSTVRRVSAITADGTDRRSGLKHLVRGARCESAVVGQGTTRETAGVTTRLIVSYVRRHRGDDGVARVLELAGETRSVESLEDELGWSSYDQKIALFEAAAVVTGDPDVARRI